MSFVWGLCDLDCLVVFRILEADTVVVWASGLCGPALQGLGFRAYRFGS